MRGNVNYQVQELYKEVNKIGESKHTAKEEARAEGNNTWHMVGKSIGIHSYGTADSYRQTWRQLGYFVKEEFKIHDLEKIKGEHVQAFLENRINTASVTSYNTYKKEASALQKLEKALNSYAVRNNKNNNYSFSLNIHKTKENAKLVLENTTVNRAYKDAKSLINNIQNEKLKLVAQTQLEGGFRISELNHIRPKNFSGIGKDPVTGEKKGIINIEQAKGGKAGEKFISVNTYDKLKNIVTASEKQIFKFNENTYRNNLKESAFATGQKYHGSHGLRYNFAQNRFQQVQQNRQHFNKALQQVSSEMSHVRADITLHYLP